MPLLYQAYRAPHSRETPRLGLNSAFVRLRWEGPHPRSRIWTDGPPTGRLAARSLVVDNLSTICRGLKENEADSWTPFQNWLLAQRRVGKSVLVIHHGGKSGQQRGTSRKEDVLDTVIALRKPPDYQADQGARFVIHFEKSRGFFGPEAEPFEVRKLGDQWQESAIKSGDDLETLTALRQQGLSVRDIADRTGLSKSTVARKLGADE